MGRYAHLFITIAKFQVINTCKEDYEPEGQKLTLQDYGVVSEGSCSIGTSSSSASRWWCINEIVPFQLKIYC